MATTATPFYSLEFVMSHEPSVRSHSSHDGMSHEMGCPPPEHSPRDDMPLTEGTKQMDQSRSQSTLSSVPEKKGCESSLTARTRFAPPLASGSQSTLTPSLQLKGQSEGLPTGAEMQTQTQHDCSAYQMGLLRTTYARPLEAAASLLHTVDADLADELYRVLSLMDRLLTDTASVLTSMSCAAQAITTQTLPVLRAALAAPRTRRTAMATSIGIVLALVAEPQNGVAQVLHSYMLVVERVYYIHRCVGAALDGHFTEEGSSADAWQGLEAEKTGQVQCRVGPSGRGVGEALGGALVHLDKATGALEECSDFWRMLRRMSHLLAGVAEAAHSIRGQLLSGPKSIDPQLGFEPFVSSLEHFCQRQLSLDQFCQHYCPMFSVGAPGRQHLHSRVADDDSIPGAKESSIATTTRCGVPGSAVSSAATSGARP